LNDASVAEALVFTTIGICYSSLNIAWRPCHNVAAKKGDGARFNSCLLVHVLG